MILLVQTGHGMDPANTGYAGIVNGRRLQIMAWPGRQQIFRTVLRDLFRQFYDVGHRSRAAVSDASKALPAGLDRVVGFDGGSGG